MGQEYKLLKLVPRDEKEGKGSTHRREGSIRQNTDRFLDVRLTDCNNTAKSQGPLQGSTRSQRRQEIDVSLEP